MNIDDDRHEIVWTIITTPIVFPLVYIGVFLAKLGMAIRHLKWPGVNFVHYDDGDF